MTQNVKIKDMVELTALTGTEQIPLNDVSGGNLDRMAPINLVVGTQAPSIIVYVDGANTSRRTTATGAITTNADAQVIIQGAIDELTTGGMIFIKKGDYTVTDGINIDQRGLSFIGESQSDEGTPSLGVYIASSTAGARIIDVTADDIVIENLQLKCFLTDQIGMRLDNAGNQGTIRNITIRGEAGAANHALVGLQITSTGAGGGTANFKFDDIHIENFDNPLEFNGAEGRAATVNHFGYITLNNYSGIGIKFERYCDNNVFDHVRLSVMNGTAPQIGVQFGDGANSAQMSGQYFGRLHIVVTDADDTAIQIWNNTTQTEHVPCTIGSLQVEGNASATLFDRQTGRLPIFSYHSYNIEKMRGFHADCIDVRGSKKDLEEITNGTEGTLKIPTDRLTAPDDTRFGDVEGAVMWEAFFGRPYWRGIGGDGVWYSAPMLHLANVYSDEQSIQVGGGSPANWRSVANSVLPNSANIGQYRFIALNDGSITSSHNHVYCQIDGKMEADVEDNEQGGLILRCVQDGGATPLDVVRIRMNIAHEVFWSFNNDFRASDISVDQGRFVYLDDFTANSIRSIATDKVIIEAGGQDGFTLSEVGTEVSVICGVQNILAITATDGFLYLPYSSGGAFNGTPTAFTGKSAMGYDQTNDNLMVYDVGEGTWKNVGGGGGGFPTSNIELVIDGGGSAIGTGIVADIQVDFNCTITQVTMLADTSTTTVMDIWVDSFANFPADVNDTITGSTKPTITTALKVQDSTLAGWTTGITAGDHIRWNVDSNNNATKLTIALKVTKT